MSSVSYTHLDVYKRQSQQSYTPPEKSATVSSPTIGKSGTLRVGVNAGSPPLAGSPSSSSKIVGIDVDVAAALADQLGLKLEIVDVGTDPEAALKEGKVDVAMGIGSESDVSFWSCLLYTSPKHEAAALCFPRHHVLYHEIIVESRMQAQDQ